MTEHNLLFQDKGPACQALELCSREARLYLINITLENLLSFFWHSSGLIKMGTKSFSGWAQVLFHKKRDGRTDIKMIIMIIV